MDFNQGNCRFAQFISVKRDYTISVKIKYQGNCKCGSSTNFIRDCKYIDKLKKISFLVNL